MTQQRIGPLSPPVSLDTTPATVFSAQALTTLLAASGDLVSSEHSRGAHVVALTLDALADRAAADVRETGRLVSFEQRALKDATGLTTPQLDGALAALFRAGAIAQHWSDIPPPAQHLQLAPSLYAPARGLAARVAWGHVSTVLAGEGTTLWLTRLIAERLDRLDLPKVVTLDELREATGLARDTVRRALGVACTRGLFTTAPGGGQRRSLLLTPLALGTGSEGTPRTEVAAPVEPAITPPVAPPPPRATPSGSAFSTLDQAKIRSTAIAIEAFRSLGLTPRVQMTDDGRLEIVADPT